jgi:SulP family sulfate permease
MAEKHEFAGLLRSSWGDATVLTATFLLTVFADLTIAIGVGVTLSAFLFLHRMAETVEVQTGAKLVAEDVADTANGQREAYEPVAPGERILVYRISGAFFFGATAAVSSVLDRIGDRPEAFVLDFTSVPLVDSTAANALGSFVRSLRSSGTLVYFAGTTSTVQGMLLRAGLTEPLVRYEPTSQAAAAHWRMGSSVRPR